MNALV